MWVLAGMQMVATICMLGKYDFTYRDRFAHLNKFQSELPEKTHLYTNLI
ncbi:hypothetical protein [Desulforamulus aquiferis]|uniref:Uncharacterized protein n=1 Tax=Desulforamulus aquiferis TaxID=1397668 RepID=A0AAW7ZAB3_9FIRM|nr:hypothetical protein [Desulforamulus aquiferis]MDO7786574.1 hypothetical protein [Desulforamulus aquiferis]RYD05765.1 hypothetical protein N752_07685 [Desulforamulus aquiferis]